MPLVRIDLRKGKDAAYRQDIGRTVYEALVSVGVPKNDRFQVVGESHYQSDLAKIAGGITDEGVHQECAAVLRLEPTNKYDPNAVEVLIAGLRVGYIPAVQAPEMCALFLHTHRDGRRIEDRHRAYLRAAKPRPFPVTSYCDARRGRRFGCARKCR